MAKYLLTIAGLILVICSGSFAEELYIEMQAGSYFINPDYEGAPDAMDANLAVKIEGFDEGSGNGIGDIGLPEYNAPEYQEPTTPAYENIQPEQYVCTDCYASIITQTDGQTLESVTLEQSLDSDSGIERTIAGSGQAGDPYVLEKVNMMNLPGNGLLVKDTDAYLLLRDFTFKNLSLQNRSSMSIGIGTQYAKNVMIENCTARSGESFRFTYSENVTIKNSTGRNLIMEGVNNGLAEGCSASAITIKGLMSPFYSSKLLDRSYDVYNDTLLLHRDDSLAPSRNCLIKDCRNITEIDIFDSRDCIVQSCPVQGTGLWLINAENITFADMAISSSILSLDWSRNITFRDARLTNCTMSIAGVGFEDYAVAFSNSTADGRPVYYYQDRPGMVLENLSAGYVWLVNCPGATVRGVDALGIYAVKSDGTAILDCRIGREGINLAFSSHCLISGNQVQGSMPISREQAAAQEKVLHLNTGSNNTAIGNVIVQKIFEGI